MTPGNWEQSFLQPRVEPAGEDRMALGSSYSALVDSDNKPPATCQTMQPVDSQTQGEGRLQGRRQRGRDGPNGPRVVLSDEKTK